MAIFAGDHGVHAQGVTPWPQEVTAQMVGNFLAGGAVVNAFARQAGASVTVVDVGVANPLPIAEVADPSAPRLIAASVRRGTRDLTVDRRRSPGTRPARRSRPASGSPTS